MKILHVTPYFAPAFCYGGPPRSLLTLCRGLRDANVDQHVLTTTANGQGELSIANQTGCQGVRVTYLERSLPRRHFVVKGLRDVLSKACHEVDLVHVHTCWNYLCSQSMQYCRKWHVPYLVSPRGMLDTEGLRRSKWRKQLALHWRERASFRDALAFVASSEREGQAIGRQGFDRPIEVIPNSLDLTDFETLPDREASRRALGLDSAQRVLLTVGRLHPQKSLEIVLTAMSDLGARQKDCRLLIVGDGTPRYRASLKTQFASLVKRGTVAFLGHLEGPQRLAAYAAADLFVTASESESFGMSIAEALAAGLPVVASDACPWPQINDWNSGYCVPRDSGRFSACLSKLIDDTDLARQMGANGRTNIGQLVSQGPVQTRNFYQYCLDEFARTGPTATKLQVSIPPR